MCLKARAKLCPPWSIELFTTYTSLFGEVTVRLLFLGATEENNYPFYNSSGHSTPAFASSHGRVLRHRAGITSGCFVCSVIRNVSATPPRVASTRLRG